MVTWEKLRDQPINGKNTISCWLQKNYFVNKQYLFFEHIFFVKTRITRNHSEDTTWKKRSVKKQILINIYQNDSKRRWK